LEFIELERERERERERESKLSLRYEVPDLTASNFWFSNREGVPLHGMRERDQSFSLIWMEQKTKVLCKHRPDKYFFAIDMH
jgi:hypothetical protein